MRSTYTGTAAWKHKVDVSDIFRNEDLYFEQRRDQIVERLRKSRAIKEETDNGQELELLVDELAETDDVPYFDMVWHAIYDLADDRKWLWINTI